ncbi:subtilisin-like protease SBT4.3 [Tanacetum coccineum]
MWFAKGTSINCFLWSEGKVPIVYGNEVTNNCSKADAGSCYLSCLEESRIHGKVVMCDFYAGIDAVKAAGALGCIAPNLGNNVSDITTFPTAALSANDFNLIKKYKLLPGNAIILLHLNPEAKILKSEAIRNPDAPFVASDSSRGPSIYFPDLIKPDITAPGVEILAAFSPLAPPSGISSDNRFKSGTSVASPHIAAAAAYIKSFHPMWSPSTIKYALMTTARAMDPNHNSDTVFAYGSGNINLKKATDPGLVYKINFDQYDNIWCHALKNSANSTFVNTTCPEKLEIFELNYPSMAVLVEVKTPFVVSFPRRVTNVGQANATYVASIQKESSKLSFSVEPTKLEFTSQNKMTTESVSLTWTDGIHVVHSPIVLYTGENAYIGSQLFINAYLGDLCEFKQSFTFNVLFFISGGFSRVVLGSGKTPSQRKMGSSN